MSANPANIDDRDHEDLKRAQRAHEPSMEEILASIRAIIADDRETAAAKSAQAAPAAKPSNPPQVIYSSFGQSRPTSDPAPMSPLNVVYARPAEDRPVEPTPSPIQTTAATPAAAVRGRAPAARDTVDLPLLSKDVESAVSTSFQHLSTAAAAPDPRRLDEMAREMLRPMVKTWLDENLPGLVERLVRAEIERIARGNR